MLDAFPNLTVGIDASQSQNKINAVNSAMSPCDVDLMGPLTAAIANNISQIFMAVATDNLDNIINRTAVLQATVIQGETDTSPVEPYIPQHVQPSSQQHINETQPARNGSRRLRSRSSGIVIRENNEQRNQPANSLMMNINDRGKRGNHRRI